MMKPSGISEQILGRSLGFLSDWEEGEVTLDDCLDTLRKENGPERAAVASLLFEYFRHKGFVDGLIARHARRDSIRKEMRLLLCCAVTQLFFQTGLARQSAVNIAVEYAKRLGGKGGGGFVNAMLRSILRDDSFDPSKIPSSFPDILKERWTQRFGEEKTAELLARYASNPPLSFRIRKNEDGSEIPIPEELSALPADLPDLAAEPFRFLETPDPAALFRSGLPESGKVYIQDPATVMALSLLEGRTVNGRFLDACAAPGGKTILMSDLAREKGWRLSLTAADRSRRRVILLNGNLKRARVLCRTVIADARETPFSPGTFDCILADVPCSNTGVIRRRPDAPWRFSIKSLQELTALQKEILLSLADLVKPGGLLLYSTCSLEEEEDRIQAETFTAARPDFVLLKDKLLLPGTSHDGAYGALFLRKASGPTEESGTGSGE